MKTTLYISNAAHIAAARVCQSSEETRYYLCGVHIVSAPQGGVYIVSTDGHRLSVAHDPEGWLKCERPDDGVIINFDDISPKWLKTQFALFYTGDGPNGVGNAKITATEPGRGHVAGEQVAVAIGREIDGTFPDWRRVLPKSDAPKKEPNPATVTHPCYNSAYIADFHKIAKIYSGTTGGRPLSIGGFEAWSAPSWVTLNNIDVHWRGVLMPMRGDDFETLVTRPDWLIEPAPMQAAAE